MRRLKTKNEIKRFLYKKQNKSCGMPKLGGCGDRFHISELQIDHILPQSKYPELKNDKKNFQLLCRTCNNDKANGITTEALIHRMVTLMNYEVKQCEFQMFVDDDIEFYEVTD